MNNTGWKYRSLHRDIRLAKPGDWVSVSGTHEEMLRTRKGLWRISQEMARRGIKLTTSIVPDDDGRSTLHIQLVEISPGLQERAWAELRNSYHLLISLMVANDLSPGIQADLWQRAENQIERIAAILTQADARNMEDQT